MKYIFLLIFLLVLLFFGSNFSFANGGDQRVVEGKYLIGLSRSPFTPKAGDNVAMIASFVDIQTGKLVKEDLIVKVRIAKLGEGRDKRQFLFEQENMKAKGGVLEFQYTFKDPGLHEVFFDFSFPSSPQKLYNAPDFLMDVQKSDASREQNLPSFPFLIISLALGITGFIAGWFFGHRKQSLSQSF